MTGFWLVMVLMTLVAVAFVLWPLLARQKSGSAAGPAELEVEAESRDVLVLDLFNEHLHALEAQRAGGELDQAQFDLLKQELELSLLDDSVPLSEPQEATQERSRRRISSPRLVIYACALLLPLAALLLYWERGSIVDLEVLTLQQQQYDEEVLAMKEGREPDAAGRDKLVISLLRSLELRPDNLQNRYLLARTLMHQGAFVKAVAQYSYIVQQDATASNVMGELAQAVFLAAGNRITPEVAQLVRRTLDLDSRDTTALGLAGIAAFEAHDYAGAIAHWQQVVAVLGAQAPASQSLQAGIARARQLLLDSGLSVPEPEATVAAMSEKIVQKRAAADKGTAAPAVEASGASLEVQLSLGDGVSVAASDTVFVYARAWQGAKMPLAIVRLSASQLPLTVTLDESTAMASNMTLSSVPRLEVVARISSTADATPQSGDWQVEIGPVSLIEQDGPLKLVVEQQLP